MNVTSTRPFSTATPESAMNPTAAEIEKGMPRDPERDDAAGQPSGTPVKTSSACRTDWNAA
jgi:hypothetical protein